MTQARQQQISLEDTPYYHCYGRCVRRAFLCGKDEFSGKDYSHRKQWIVDRLGELSNIFAIDVCAYAVMSNHYHTVLHINQQKADTWTDKEVIQRWQQLFQGTLLTQKYAQGENLTVAEHTIVTNTITLWRERLTDISWLMRCLNEYIARQANAEDNCKGRFWEGRFKSRALLDETALLTCMAYVDLNPIRANQANTPEDSNFTSIQQRIREYAQPQTPPQTEEPPTITLTTLGPTNNPTQQPTTQPKIPFTTKDYLDLVDWTGRTILAHKSGHIAENAPPILTRLNLEPKQYLNQAQHFTRKFPRVAGTLQTLKTFCHHKKLAWVQGMGKKTYHPCIINTQPNNVPA